MAPGDLTFGASEPLRAQFWSSPRVAAALACCDVAVLLKEIRRDRGWTQAELAAAVGYSQTWVSKVLRGRQALTVSQVRALAQQLGIPVHLLRIGDGREEDPTKRRDFGKAVTLALIALPARPEVGEDSAAMVASITAAQRRLEATTAARELARSVTAHAELSGRLQARARRSPFGPDVAAVASEAVGLAAWLHADMYDLGTARTYYRMAVDLARQAGHQLLAGYMLGSLAAFEIDHGNAGYGLGLIGRVRAELPGAGHPTASAWLAANEAIGHAANGKDSAAAAEALRRAEMATDKGATSDPPWPWVFAFDHAKLAGYRALAAVRLGHAGEALDAFTESLPAARPAPKQRAVVMLEVATAVRQEAVAARDPGRVDDAFRLGLDALNAGVRYASERVIQRAHRFRRGYAGPATSAVREFDDRLSASVP